MRLHCLVVALSCCLPVFVLAAEPQWQSGSARAKITPEEFMWMAGYGGRTVPADGKLTELWAKAVVLRDAAGNDAVLIAADLVGIGAESTQWIAGQLKERHGLNRDQFAIATSHTHTGPALSDNLVPLHYLRADSAQQNRMVQYTLWMRQKLVDVVGMAYEDLEPVHLTWGTGLCTFAVNRRNNTEAEVPQLRVQGKLQGPYDHDVPVLAVRDNDFKLKTILFGYACHATVLSLTKWSGDYPGYAQIGLEERYPQADAIFWAGCGADQNPLPRRTAELAQDYGQRLAQSVDSVLRGTMKQVSGGLHTTYAEIDGMTQQSAPSEQLEQLAKSGNQYEQPFARYRLDRSAELQSRGQTYPYPVQSWQIGDQIRMVLLAGEVVVDYALKLKSTDQSAKDPAVWVAGYCNDVMAYIPSRRVLLEGGYEGGGSNLYYGFPALWSEQFEQQILDEVRRQWDGSSQAPRL